MVLFDEGAVKGESKAEFVYRVLRDDILSGQYAPGTALYIRELSTQLQQIEQRHHQIPVESKNELAACDREFHMAIAKSAYNHQMYQMIEKVFFKLTRVDSVITQAHLPDSLVQHNNVLEAIQEGNAEAARRYMSEHDQDILTAIRLFQYQNIHLFRT